MNKETQEHQVVEAMRGAGGYATLRRLNEIVDFSSWKTKTPEASIRRIVQNSGQFFRIRPGLWALTENRERILQRLDLTPGNDKSEEQFSHGYYQGLLVKIGKTLRRTTYIPAQDQNRKFIDQPLKDISDLTELPSFTYETLMKRAKTVDVIWFNGRMMPSAFYEVEHTTDIRNSLSKFYELQDFHAQFYIVANKSRRSEFEDKLHASMFEVIENRVIFLEYERIVNRYEALRQEADFRW